MKGRDSKEDTTVYVSQGEDFKVETLCIRHRENVPVGAVSVLPYSGTGPSFLGERRRRLTGPTWWVRSDTVWSKGVVNGCPDYTFGTEVLVFT